MTVCNSNFLQPNGFKISIDRENYPNLEFLIQSVDHPMVQSDPSQAAYSRVGAVPQPGDKITFGEVTFSIILDEAMNGYTEVYNWMKRNVENAVVTPTDNAIPHVTDVTLTILNSTNNSTGTIVYRDAFPISIGEIRLEASSTDISPILIPVTFTYTYFDIS